MGMGQHIDTRPDCLSNGPHRWGSTHFMPSDKTIMMQTCRRCGEKRFSRMEIVNGKMVDVPTKTSTQSNRIDKSTNENDVK